MKSFIFLISIIVAYATVPAFGDDANNVYLRLLQCTSNAGDDPILKQVLDGFCIAKQDAFSPIYIQSKKIFSALATTDQTGFKQAIYLEGMRNIALNYARELEQEGQLGSPEQLVNDLCHQASKGRGTQVFSPENLCAPEYARELTAYVHQIFPQIKKRPPEDPATTCQNLQKEIGDLNSMLDKILYPISNSDHPGTLKQIANYQNAYLNTVSTYPGAYIYTQTLFNQVGALKTADSITQKVGKNHLEIVHHGQINCAAIKTPFGTPQNPIQIAQKELKTKLLAKAEQLNQVKYHGESALQSAASPSSVRGYKQYNLGQVELKDRDELVKENAVSLGYLLAAHPEYYQDACDTLKDLEKQRELQDGLKKSVTGAVIVGGVIFSAATAGAGTPIAVGAAALTNVMLGMGVATTLEDAQNYAAESVEATNADLSAWAGGSAASHQLAVQAQAQAKSAGTRLLVDAGTMAPIGLIAKAARTTAKSSDAFDEMLNTADKVQTRNIHSPYGNEIEEKSLISQPQFGPAYENKTREIDGLEKRIANYTVHGGVVNYRVAEEIDSDLGQLSRKYQEFADFCESASKTLKEEGNATMAAQFEAKANLFKGEAQEALTKKILYDPSIDASKRTEAYLTARIANSGTPPAVLAEKYLDRWDIASAEKEISKVSRSETPPSLLNVRDADEKRITFIKELVDQTKPINAAMRTFPSSPIEPLAKDALSPEFVKSLEDEQTRLYEEGVSVIRDVKSPTDRLVKLNDIENRLLKTTALNLQAKGVRFRFVKTSSFLIGSGSDDGVAIEILPGGNSQLNRLAASATDPKKLGLNGIYYSPKTNLTRMSDASFSSGSKGAYILMDNKTVLTGSSSGPSLTHELMHAKVWSDYMKGKMSPVAGMAESNEPTRLPGGSIAGNYDHFIGLDEPETYSLNLRQAAIDAKNQLLKDQSKGEPFEFLHDTVANGAHVVDRVQAIANYTEEAVSRAYPTLGLQSANAGGRLLSGTVNYVKKDGKTWALVMMKTGNGEMSVWLPASNPQELVKQVQELVQNAHDKSVLFNAVKAHLNNLSHTTNPTQKQKMLDALVSILRKRPLPGEKGYTPLLESNLDEVWAASMK